MSWQHDPAVGHTKGLTLEGAREIYVLILGSDWLHLCVSEKSQINKQTFRSNGRITGKENDAYPFNVERLQAGLEKRKKIIGTSSVAQKSESVERKDKEKKSDISRSLEIRLSMAKSYPLSSSGPWRKYLLITLVRRPF